MVVSVVVGLIISRRSRWRTGEEESVAEQAGDGEGDGKGGKKGGRRGGRGRDPMNVTDSLPDDDDILLTPTSQLGPSGQTTEEDNLLEPDNVQVREDELGELVM